jgi:hypothetical protein
VVVQSPAQVDQPELVAEMVLAQHHRQELMQLHLVQGAVAVGDTRANFRTAATAKPAWL